jgi:hypothetical protein
MRRASLAVLLLAALLLTGGCAVLGRADSEPAVVFKATGESVLEEAGALPAPGAAFGTVLQATGTGFPAADAATAGQRRLTAMEAAKYRALAALVEKAEGTRIERESRVLNLQFAGEAIEATTTGKLTGVSVVKREWDESEQQAEVTLRVVLDQEGEPVRQLAENAPPESLKERRARAEQAARVQALARLRQQVGEFRVGQRVRVKNLVLDRQEAWLVVDGMLEGVEFSRPRWPSDDHCVVTARLEASQKDLERLRELAGAGAG